MQTGRCATSQQRTRLRLGQRHTGPCLSICSTGGRDSRPFLASNGVKARALARANPGQKDMTAELLERAFTFALMARLKQHGGIDVDVRSTAWGLMEGKFGGMTVRGSHWRTPLELTAQQLMVDVGELVLDYNKLMWQQTVALKNVPQGSVSFTLTSQDLANFMAHPIMVEAAARAVQGHAFLFDRSTASVRLDPATGSGVITYEGVWAANGQRYAVTMTTPPPTATPTATPPLRPSQPPPSLSPRGATASSPPAASTTMEQLTVYAVRLPPPPGRSTTGSFASLGSGEYWGSQQAGQQQQPQAAGARDERGVTGAGDPSEAVVGEGLRRFFSALTLNLQGIEVRNPVLLVQLPNTVPRPAAASPITSPSAAAAGGAAGGGPGGMAPLSPVARPTLLPALLTITMRVAILQLPPLNMKF